MQHTLESMRSLAVTLIAFGSLATGASGSVIFDITQVGSDIVVSSSGGSFNLSGFTLGGSFSSPLTNVRMGLKSNDDAIFIGTGATDYYGGLIQGPTPTLPLNVQQYASAAFGPWYGIYPPLNRLFVPQGYISGNVLPSSSATYLNFQLSDWGLVVGDQFVWTLSSGSDADSVTLMVVPEPSSTALLLGGLALVAVRRRQ